MLEASTTSWFNNTVFIFVADHGFRVGKNDYDLELSYQHIPIFFYNPKLIKPEINKNFTGQIDIFPILMNLLQLKYINNTFGIDAINQPRPAMYFSSDDKIGCIDSQWLYIYRFSGNEGLYSYKNGDQTDYKDQQLTIKKKLKDYAFSQIQYTEIMFKENKTFILKK